MLNTEQVSKVAAVVQSVALEVRKLEKKQRTYAMSRAAEQANTDRRRERRRQRFEQILNQIETGFHNVMVILEDARLSLLLDSLAQTDKRFRLYDVVGGTDDIVISALAKRLYLDIRSSRLSPVQGYNSPARYDECIWSRWCGLTTHAPSITATFRHLLLQDFDEWWSDWMHPERPKTFNIVVDETVDTEYLMPEDFHFQRFFKHDSLGLAAEIRAYCERSKALADEGYEDDSSYVFRLHPGFVLARFFYDCADVKTLQQHLARAINTL